MIRKRPLAFCARFFWVGSLLADALSGVERTVYSFHRGQKQVAQTGDSRWTGAFLAAGSWVLVIYGLSAGDWGQFVEQWRTSRFIHVMSLDFCMLWLLFPTLLRDDMARRSLNDSRIFWLVTLIPLLGAVMYLVLRPSLTNDKSMAEAAAV